MGEDPRVTKLRNSLADMVNEKAAGKREDLDSAFDPQVINAKLKAQKQKEQEVAMKLAEGIKTVAQDPEFMARLQQQRQEQLKEQKAKALKMTLLLLGVGALIGIGGVNILPLLWGGGGKKGKEGGEGSEESEGEGKSTA